MDIEKAASFFSSSKCSHVHQLLLKATLNTLQILRSHFQAGKCLTGVLSLASKGLPGSSLDFTGPNLKTRLEQLLPLVL